MTLSRRAARRTALFLLYQWDLTGQPLGTNYDGEIDAFARNLAEAVAGNAEQLDARISAVSGDWPAGQLGTLERNILRIGIHELDEGTVPLEVVIDEAVTLAKRYASEDAGRLVNGILGAISRGAAA
jgi:N utilization substance protein B